MTAAGIVAKTISKPEITHCLLVKSVFHIPIKNNNAKVMADATIRLDWEIDIRSEDLIAKCSGV